MVVALTTAMEMVEEVTAEDSEIAKEVQVRYEFYLSQLKAMLADIPRKYQKKISLELCSNLAHCLTNSINFEIVKGLMDIQHVTEKYLIHLRQKVTDKQLSETAKALEGAPPSEHENIRRAMAIKHHKQLIDVDMKLVKQLDQKVAEQQETLQKAGFPGFYVTMSSAEIKVQIFLLDFILRLSKMEIPDS
ncbi:Gonadal protein gdl [Frankliniella fusca]|uniref:Gonadal protein gdl n=1 Tax=Frankliniella fusca TaxID=407009 RepID=A0AAE1HR74_9NEOP|nr:Gonadal protein gdl [Frankliniella fusca]